MYRSYSGVCFTSKPKPRQLVPSWDHFHKPTLLSSTPTWKLALSVSKLPKRWQQRGLTFYRILTTRSNHHSKVKTYFVLRLRLWYLLQTLICYGHSRILRLRLPTWHRRRRLLLRRNSNNRHNRMSRKRIIMSPRLSRLAFLEET